MVRISLLAFVRVLSRDLFAAALGMPPEADGWISYDC